VTPFDVDRLMARIEEFNRIAEQQNAELEAMLDEIDPDWKERAEAEKREKAAAKIERRSSKKPAPVVTETKEEPMPRGNLIDSDVLAILKQATTNGNLLYIPKERLERGLYERFNEVLSRLGGKWKGGKTQAHVFDDPAGPLLAEVLATGLMPPDNPLDFYRTPESLAERLAQLVSGQRLLEPSAGDGAIVRALLKVHPTAEITAVEVEPKRAEKLRALSVTVIEGDFLAHHGEYDGVAMNPPFTLPGDKLAYIAHVKHAWSLLVAGGTLAAIVPAGIEFRDDTKTTALRELILQHGTIERLPVETFKESGTSVATALVTMRKTEVVKGQMKLL